MANFGALGWLSAASTFLEAWGVLSGGRAQRLAGQRAKVAAEFEAIQAEEQAGIALALAQRRAAEERRQAGMDASRALAVAAASGGGVSDPTIVRLIANTRGEGVYRANVAMYEGEAQARKLRLEAAASRVAGAEALAEGTRRQGAALYSAVGIGAKGALSLYAKYGMKGPDNTPAPKSGGTSGDSALLRTPDGAA